ncbi:aldehyde dehydrogenase family protein [Spirillospora sp. NPDC048911]|uniref:aldehyde dehydrogenase family protein n=1 Tax=Spirillospora sp. NPDC048911 TaxID=3364527 RepID=UPI00371DBBF6
MRHSYRVLVGGAHEDGAGWVHWVRVGDALEAPYDMAVLKAALDTGEAGPGAAAHPAVVGRVALGTADQRHRAVAAARAAQPGWAAAPATERLGLVTAFDRALHARQAELVELLVAEGHPVRVARFEVATMLAAVHPCTVADAAAQLARRTTVNGRRVDLVRKPDGVVGLVPARNAAAATLVFSAVMALAAGNAVVVDLPPSGPLSAAFICHELLAPLLGGHDGVLSAVCSPVRDVLPEWLASPHIDDIYYFGPTSRGLDLAADCIRRGKKPILELSANDTVVIWQDAPLDLAVQALLEAFYASGQICLTPNRAVLHPQIADQVIDRLRQQIDRLPVGRPERDDVILSPVVRRGEFTDVVAQALNAGATLVTGGQFVDVRGESRARGPFIRPALLRVDGLSAARSLRAVHDETFFPLLTTVVASSGRIDDVIAFLNDNRHGLRNSLWATDPDIISTFRTEVRNAGTLKINDSHIGPIPTLPIDGGTGHTSGAIGEASLPMLRTSHLQGISTPLDIPDATLFDHSAAVSEDHPTAHLHPGPSASSAGTFRS